MAGGIGSRFWPLSTTKTPKQFLDILGTGKTLIQQTFERFNKIIPSENIFIASNEIYKNLILEQIPSIKPHQVLLEPDRKNTAPCIAYANKRIQALNPNASIVVAPSDHFIVKESDFLEIINKGLDFVSKQDVLLTLGIKPTRPETGYGYIQTGEKSNNPIKKVKTFTEKPNIEMAKIFFESGEFYWNSGLFLWSLPTVLKAFEEHLPEIYYLFEEGIDVYNTPSEQQFINNTYPKSISISIDYGLMEKASNVYVYESDFGWSDLGTWGSLFEHLTLDKNRNAVYGKNVSLYNTANCIINMPQDKTVVINGLDDFIVVESNNTLLICKKSDEQNIKNYVAELKSKKE
jgi:mannose-1-phosphate guanylyltransferase